MKRPLLAGIALLAAFLATLWMSRPGARQLRSTGVAAGWLPQPTGELVCTPWREVSDRAFGLPSGDGQQPYQSEESFEVAVFKDRLYVGVEADNQLGARLWRTTPPGQAPKSQADWEEVIADPEGLPWGVENLSQVDHIDSLAEFSGQLFVSSANAGEPTGTLVFRSPTGDRDSWQDALKITGPGFGDANNENFKDMQVFEGWLCGGTWNQVEGAEVWCTWDGDHWEQKNTAGFGDPANVRIWTSSAFKGDLYFSVQRPGSPGGVSSVIYRTASLEEEPDWELVFQGIAGTGAALLLGEFNGQLYFSTGGIDGVQMYASPSGDPGSWRPSSRPGMVGSRLNTQTNIDAAVVYQGFFHIAVQNPLFGFRVWRLDDRGIWTPSIPIAGQDPGDFAAQLAVFQEDLYAWTSNYSLGQAVLQSHCVPSERVGGDQRLAGILLIGVASVLLVWRFWGVGGENRPRGR